MRRKIAYCTIGCASYLSRIEVLEDSLKSYNHNAELHILLSEHPDICKDIYQKTGRTLYSPQDIGCTDWLQMAFCYDMIEYSHALKPFFIEKLIQDGYESVFYLNPDIEILSSLDQAESLIPIFDIVLTLPICVPLTDDNKTPRVEDMIGAGQFNPGYIGVSSSPDVRRLLKWWQEVCLKRRLFFHDHWYSVDQLGTDVFSSFVEKVYVLSDHAYNMSYWNYYQRKVEYKGSKWITESGELKLFHFSGFSKDELTQVYMYHDRIHGPNSSDLYTLVSQYFEKLNKAQWSVFAETPYSFARYSNGETISQEDRKLFSLMNSIERREIPNPFENRDFIKSIFEINGSDQSGKLSFKWKNLLLNFKLCYEKYFSENVLLNQYINTSRYKGFSTANKYALRYIIRKIYGERVLK